MAEIKLYNMDNMIAMKEMKDKEFDLAIVDKFQKRMLYFLMGGITQ